MPHPAASPSTANTLPVRASTAALAIALALTLTFTLTAGLPLPVVAAPSASFDSAFGQFQQALGGQSAAADDAARQWRALSDAAPADPVLRAYAGAATALLATTTLLPWRKMTHAEDGLALIDKALAQLTPAHDAPAHQGVPASLEARFVAASTFLGLPSMFNRHARGARLLDEVLHSPLIDSAPLPFRGSVWMAAGHAAAKDKRPDEARQWWQKVIAIGAPQAALAQSRLQAL